MINSFPYYSIPIPIYETQYQGLCLLRFVNYLFELFGLQGTWIDYGIEEACVCYL